jgi:hypothetical protein
MQNDWDVFSEQAVAGGAFVEIERLAFAQNRDVSHGYVYAGGIEWDTGAACGGEDAAPIGVASREGGFDERRGGDRFGDAFGCCFRFRTAHFDFDDALRAFSVSDDLQRERPANVFERRGERAMRRATGANRWRPRRSVGEDR